MSLPTRSSGAFSSWEIGLALRYLRAKRKEGGVALIAIISFIGILLAVMALIVVLSIMSENSASPRVSRLAAGVDAALGPAGRMMSALGMSCANAPLTATARKTATNAFMPTPPDGSARIPGSERLMRLRVCRHTEI